MVTTVIRGAPAGAPTGMVYVVDVNHPRVISATPVFETRWAWAAANPRGGHRGARGIATVDGRIAIANADEIHVFDRAWQRTAVLSDRAVGDIHELCATPEGVWACSTRSDEVVHLGWDGHVRDRWSWREDAALVRRFGYRSVAPVDDRVDYRVLRAVNVEATDLGHVNGVIATNEGLLVSLGRVRLPSPSARERAAAFAGAVARAALVGRPVSRRLRADRLRRFGADPQPGARRRGLIALVRPGRAAQVLSDRPLPGWSNHNQLVHGSELVLCDTGAGAVVAVDRDSSAERQAPIPQPSCFLRGLAWLGDDRFLAGTRRPAALWVADLSTGRAERALTLSGEQRESVHDIEPLPDAWDDPPSRL